mmetsp:Transcript_82332/g.218165  ORF Transcript_82332/g.218165 Transcript_82332/m.218165 type:complete len:258 (+) Transcript_82332:2178-2951(+)
MASRAAGCPETYSPAARIAMAAANFPSHRWVAMQCSRRPINDLPACSQPNFLTNASTFASPDFTKLSSSSSSSSSSTAFHWSSSSTSAMNARAVLSALWGRSGTALTKAFALDSKTVETHSSARARAPSPMLPFASAKVSIMDTHSAYRGLKNTAVSSALAISDVSDSSNAEESAVAKLFSASSTSGRTGCMASIEPESSTFDTSSATSASAAALSAGSGAASPALTRAPSSCRLDMTSCTRGELSSSPRSRRAASL